jgi:hypothetical protein
VAGGLSSLWLAGYFWETNLHKTAICAETKPFCFHKRIKDYKIRSPWATFLSGETEDVVLM